MNLSPTALEALRAAQTAFTKSEADVFEDALARGLEAADREGRIVGAFQAQELALLERRVAELESQLAALNAQGSVLKSRPDGITRQIAPTQVLREVPDGEHYAAVHHEYRNGRDLPGAGGR